ncbi:MAG: hypothetical protein LBH29_02755 [Elusimicrobiota bacterium]|jgi:hypothetical protein|nr:hypothetical protein [Elusimicrobiota bacterium]
MTIKMQKKEKMFFYKENLSGVAFAAYFSFAFFLFASSISLSNIKVIIVLPVVILILGLIATLCSACFTHNAGQSRV